MGWLAVTGLLEESHSGYQMMLEVVLAAHMDDPDLLMSIVDEKAGPSSKGHYEPAHVDEKAGPSNEGHYEPTQMVVVVDMVLC